MSCKLEENGFSPSDSDPKSVCHILGRVLQLLQQEGALGSRRDVPVVTFKHPEELKKLLDFELKTSSVNNEEELWSLVQKVIKHCVKTSQPFFLNQLYGGLDPYGLAGAWISEALNTSQYTYEVAPVFTLAEIAVIKRVLSLVGFENGDGTFAPGGSVSNMFAITLARYRIDPDVKRKGVSHLPPLVLFTSEDSHYSMLKASHWLGIGTENVVKVKVDFRGRMKPDALVACIQQSLNEGKKPFFVNATAGTTVLGAFDPIEPIADVCEKFNLWLHIDACWGGSLIFSEKYSGLLKGTHRADSYAWNPHKMLGAPLQCSIIVIKEKGLLHKCNSAAATYLFQQDKFYDTQFDTGDKSVQCGRKVDAFKLWMMWFARGDDGFRKLVDNTISVSRYFYDKIKNRNSFKLVIPEFECTNICFWYIPANLLNQPETDEWWKKIEQVAPKIKECMILTGSLMIGYQPLPERNLCNFFRLVTTCHPPLTNEDMDFVIKEIEKHGQNL